MTNCADCGGFDVEWMYSCPKHKGVEYCRGCECPICAEEERDEYDPELLDEDQIMKLYEMEITPVPELNDHPELKPMRPNPVGIAGSCVNRYVGTDIYQWWKQLPSAYWVQHGEPIYLKEDQIMIEITLKEAEALVEMFGGDPETVIVIEHLEDGHSGEGLYAYCDGYQDEGYVYIGNDEDCVMRTRSSNF